MNEWLQSDVEESNWDGRMVIEAFKCGGVISYYELQKTALATSGSMVPLKRRDDALHAALTGPSETWRRIFLPHPEPQPNFQEAARMPSSPYHSMESCGSIGGRGESTSHEAILLHLLRGLGRIKPHKLSLGVIHSKAGGV